MFGYVNINKSSLSKENIIKYRSFYCGLCHVLGEKYGLFSRLTLTYDMTFLSLFLSAFYGENIEYSIKRCFVHPFKKHKAAYCASLEYAASMNVALAYYNCLDDWHDDRNIFKGTEAFLIKKHYKKIKKQYPRQCESIELCIKELSDIEKRGVLNADISANCFARLMGELFVYRDDENREGLYNFGYDLGKFIYIMDACCDLKTDLRKEKYNPFVSTDSEEIKDILDMLANSCIEKFIDLGKVSENEVLKNIIYSGIWIKYTKMMHEENKKGGDGKSAG
ncbi:MAG: hypothetical protein IJZ94_03495 [Clostridia bacterium]|nr:hypothetical protein [Clostridia bacterium]